MKHFVTHPDFPDLKYYPSSGNFRWRVNKRGHTRKGMVAGSFDKDGYLETKYNQKRYKLHRIAHLFMTGCWPEHEIDHDNGIRDDNRWSNLKPATDIQNARNMKRSSRNTSGTTGVGWDRSRRMWVVSIGRRRIGRFKSKKKAIRCREAATIKCNYHPNHGKR